MEYYFRATEGMVNYIDRYKQVLAILYLEKRRTNYNRFIIHREI